MRKYTLFLTNYESGKFLSTKAVDGGDLDLLKEIATAWVGKAGKGMRCFCVVDNGLNELVIEG